jgi:hypothetical protein
MVFTDEEVSKVRYKSSFDEDVDDWDVPAFFLKNKDVSLPNIKKAKSNYTT